MIEHKILINKSYYECLGKNGANIFQEIINLYDIDITKGYLFEYTRDTSKDDLQGNCKVYINKYSHLLIWTFDVIHKEGKLTPINNSYSMLIIPKSDIIKIEISEQKKFYTMLPSDMKATIEFNNNCKIEFNLKDNAYNDNEEIIKFILSLT